jgi:hypothetical protein
MTETERKLAEYEALVDAGVEAWEGYDEAMLTVEKTMTEAERNKAREAAWLLRGSLKDLEVDLHAMSDGIVAIQWEQVQADFVALTRRMEVS